VFLQRSDTVAPFLEFYRQRQCTDRELRNNPPEIFFPSTRAMTEEWRPIADFEDYEASNTGHVRSIKFGKVRIRKPGLSSSGYYIMRLCKAGKPYQFGLQRIIAQCFIPNPDGKPCVDHIDRDPLNNHCNNLRWCTGSENGANRPGTSLTGYKGVHRSLEKFYAKIYFKTKFIYLGTFDTALLAHQAYTIKARELFGEFACTSHVNGGFLPECPAPATNVITMTEVADSPTSSVYSQETDSDDECVDHASQDEPTLYVRTLVQIDDGVTLSWS